MSEREEIDNIEESCEVEHHHDNVVKRVSSIMPDEEMLYDLADFYKVFADSTRIKILYALLQSELCVCDLAEVLGASQSAVSHQLRMLKQMKLVKFRREGKAIVYSLSDDHIQNILSQGFEHITE
ncbi:MAG: transcriptional regulator [Clostridiales bacterium]|jgi:DNA-binding transcriptional ArsR family regulator|uniref:ArsR/SmtB family transcription factor n=1 Tax=Bovifimicola ammoniilytica TaxID=2981720 RepID=UPI00033B8990|nr:metalloregulator ArsR/SmtB family transcription factor [Bovifimicola ammoniilytica]MBD8941519.1 transcriptional regulator [Clostridiales bacterium]CCZ05176.1 transcriptional regulator ArsR family [Eubacterium sp. CAG:603]SCJ40834.1 Transcriptional repressor smtB homolog [uncultured Eubacterium sp.]